MFDRLLKKYKSIPAYIRSPRLWYGARLYFLKYFAMPLTIRTAAGARIHLGEDKVDDIILKDLNTKLTDAYFAGELGLRSGDVVMDVGGHHGLFSVELCARFPGLKVFSFEPDALSYRYLVRNLSLNPVFQITPVNAALGNRSGQANIIRSEEGSWGNFVTHEKILDGARIRTLAAAEFIKEHGLTTIQYLKINAEGAEFEVIPALLEIACLPLHILLFAHPERGDVAGLLRRTQQAGYVCLKQNHDPVRPWYLFKLEPLK